MPRWRLALSSYICIIAFVLFLSYFFLCNFLRRRYTAHMKKRPPHRYDRYLALPSQIPYQWKQWGSFVLLLIIVFCGIWYWQGWFGVQSQFASGQQKMLERMIGLQSGQHLSPIDGTLYMGPNKSVRPAWYTFIGMPPSLDFWLYNFTYEDARRQFHELASKGAVIRGIMEKLQYGQKEDMYGQLLEAFQGNANLHLIPDDRLGVEFMHAKTFLTPDKAIIQTANLTFSSFSKNREWFFMTADSGVVASLHYLHDADRYDMPFDRDLLHPNLVVCPINCRARVEWLLSGATSSIRMYQQYIYDTWVQKLLEEKRRQWVDVQIILWKFDDAWWMDAVVNDPEGESFALVMSGTIKAQSNPYVHAKMILIDDTYLLLGSMNMSQTSLDKNREIGVVLMQPEHIRYFKTVFAKDWKAK